MRQRNISPLPMSPRYREVMGPVLSCSFTQGWFAHAPTTRVSLLCCPGKLSWVLQQVRSRDSSPTLMTSRPALLPAIGGMGLSGGISSSTMSLHGRQMEVLSDSYLWGWLTCNTHRVWGLKSRVYCCCLGMESSLLLSQPGGQLSQDSQVRGGVSCV